MADKQYNIIIQNALQDLINTIPNLFEENELAFISLQQKNERQIRDKVAFNLQKLLDEVSHDTFVVKCEWPSSCDEKKFHYDKTGFKTRRPAVDMAVLEMENGVLKKALALVEFKSHCFLNYEEWPYKEFANDVNKMANMTKLTSDLGIEIKDADLYFVMTTSIHDQKREKYDSAVVYKDILDLADRGNSKSRRKPVLIGDKQENIREVKERLNKFWSGFYNLTLDFGDSSRKVKTPYQLEYSPGTNIKAVPDPVLKCSGKAFGYTMYQTGMIWGPYKSSDIIISQ